MNEIDKLVQAIVEQDTIAGQNPILTENDIQQMKLMGSTDDVQQFAISKGISSAKVNSALISAGLDTSADPLGDISGLFGFGTEDSIIGGLPSDYTPRNPADTDFYRQGDEYNIFANLPVEDLYSLQARLIQGGLLARGSCGTFSAGLDSSTFFSALSLSLLVKNTSLVGIFSV